MPNYNVDVDRLSLILLATDTRRCPRNRPPQGHTRTTPNRPSSSPSVLVENPHSLELNKLSASERYARKLDMSDKNAGGCCRQVRGHHAVNTRHTHTTIALHLRHKFVRGSLHSSHESKRRTRNKKLKLSKAGARRGVHRPPSTCIYILGREVRSERSREPVVSRSPTPIETLDGHILHLGLISIKLRNKKRAQQCHHCFTVSHTGTPPNSFAWRSCTKLGPRAWTCTQTQKTRDTTNAGINNIQSDHSPSFQSMSKPQGTHAWSPCTKSKSEKALALQAAANPRYTDTARRSTEYTR